MSTYILQIETSTDICSCAISRDGTTIILHDSYVSNSHTEVLTILVERCIHDAGLVFSDLNAISLSTGPGSYTSLRVGAATAKGICYALSIPLIGLDSLTILAHGLKDLDRNDNIIVPMIDARRMDVYMAIYNVQHSILMEKNFYQIEETTTSILLNYGHHILLCGSGSKKYIESYPSPNLQLHHTQTSAGFMSGVSFRAFKEAKFEDVAYFEPSYLKPPNITKSQKKLF